MFRRQEGITGPPGGTLRIGIALVCVLAAGAAVASDLDHARALIQEGRLDEARAILEGTVNDPALKGESLVLLTRLSNLKEDFEAGTGYGKQAVGLLPASSEAH